MPSNSGGACTPICSVMTAPQSPPWATNREYPRRFINTTQARAMRTGSHPVAVGFAENPSPGRGGTHDRDRVRRAAAVRRGVGERLDDLQLLEDRAGPPVRDDQRQRVLMLGADVDEMNVQSVDLSDELRQGVQFGLALA